MRAKTCLTAVLLNTVLVGCTLAPGMRADRDLPAATEESPEGVTSISWDLVKTLSSEPRRTSQDLDALLTPPQPYRIGPADILSIVVWDHPELVFPTQTYTAGIGFENAAYSGAPSVPGYVVSQQGHIQFPYVGTLKVAGLTAEDVRDRLTRSLARVVQAPQVTVRVLAYRSQRIYVDGEVRSPGSQFVDDVPMTLVEALGRAGGINGSSGDSSRIRVSRKDRSWTIDLPALLQAGRDPSGIQLLGGDLVHVAPREDGKVFVLGEVNKPLAVLPRNGSLTLGEALGEAGGVNPRTSDPRQIYVVRRHAAGRPEVFHIDAHSPVALALAEGFPLRPRDVVYVDAGDITRWARVVNQLIPSAQFVNATASALK